ncbi:MAG: hypothetical protein II040_08045 [Muribaculaceae bacterium]|nr:hypothetical protein [Muribaculaceae bacterium]
MAGRQQITVQDYSRRAAARVNSDTVTPGIPLSRVVQTVSVEPVVMTSSTSRICWPASRLAVFSLRA